MIINMNGAKAPEPEQPDYQEKTTQATSFPVSVTPDVGYDAMTKVTVTAPANLSAGNIRSGVNIAGVTGSYAPTTQTKVTTPTAFPTVVNVDSGYDGMTKVTVNAPSNLSAGNIKSGVSIAGVTGTYTGESPTAQSKSVTPNSFPVTVYPDSNYNYLTQVTVKKPTSLVASAIAPGQTICGIDGTWEPNLQDRTVRPNQFPYTVQKTSSSYNGLGTVTVNTPNNLTADNIANGVTIAGITGTYTGATPNVNEVQYSRWPCFGTAVTGSGSKKSVTVGQISGGRNINYMAQGSQCLVSLDVMGSQPMGVDKYNANLTTSTNVQTAVMNSYASDLCSLIDDLVGSTTWSCSAKGIFAGYEDSPLYIYSNSSATNTTCTITKSGSSVRIKAMAGYSVPCYCSTSTCRIGFYPITMSIY